MEKKLFELNKTLKCISEKFSIIRESKRFHVESRPVTERNGITVDETELEEDKILRTHIENVTVTLHQRKGVLSNETVDLITTDIQQPHACDTLKSCCKLSGGRCTYNIICAHLVSENSYIKCDGDIASPIEIANGLTICYSWRTHFAHPSLLLQTWLLARYTATTIRMTEMKTVRDIGRHVLNLEAKGHIWVKAQEPLLPMKGDDSEQKSITQSLRVIRNNIKENEDRKRKLIKTHAKEESKCIGICDLDELEENR